MTRARVSGRERVRGALLMLSAIGVFALTDVATKWLSSGYGGAQVIALRCAAALVLAGPVALRAGSVAPSRIGLHLLRGALMLGAAGSMFHAFARLSLFDAYVVFFTAPFLTMVAAVLLLGERVSARAWSWVGLGFAGVLMAAGPGVTGGGPWTGYLAAFTGTACYALMMVVTRRLGSGEGLAVALAIPATMGVVLVGPIAALEWVRPSAADAAVLALNGVLWALANLTLTAAVRAAEPSRLAPLDFTAMVYALVFDALVFRLSPDPAALAGAAVVMLACLGHQRHQRRERG